MVNPTPLDIIDYPDALARPKTPDPKQDKVAWLALKDLTDKLAFRILLPKAPMFPPLKTDPPKPGYVVDYREREQKPVRLPMCDRVVQKLLAPFLVWDPSKGSFRTSGTNVFYGYHTLVIESVTHELGHLLHLVDPPPMTGPTSLTDYLATLSPEHQQQSEIEARATNHLVAEKFLALEPEADVVRWVGFKTPDGELKPPDDEILAQAKTMKTRAIAERVFNLLRSVELPSVERAAHLLGVDD